MDGADMTPHPFANWRRADLEHLADRCAGKVAPPPGPLTARWFETHGKPILDRLRQEEAVKAEAVRAIRRSLERQRRLAQFDDDVPPHLRPEAFKPERFRGDLQALKRVRDLRASESDTDKGGLFLFGPAGAGKTRAAVEMYWSLAPGCECQWWPVAKLKSELAKLRANEDGKAELLDSLANADELFLDDFGHVLSAPFLEFLRLVFESRGDCGAVITSNFSLRDLYRRGEAEGYPELMASLVRRIDESCEPVEFRMSPIE